LESSNLIWRPIVIAILGLALAVTILLVPWDWRLVWQQWGSWSLFEHAYPMKWVALALAVCLALLAAVEIQSLLRKTTLPRAGEPLPTGR
jgi:TRAP-type C4-dicarboxylate transport system permease small subunit